MGPNWFGSGIVLDYLFGIGLCESYCRRRIRSDEDKHEANQYGEEGKRPEVLKIVDCLSSAQL